MSDHERKGGKRGKATGWSPGAGRRNVKFLRSVDERELHGLGLALTLTLRTCPVTVDDWRKLLQAWQMRQQRGGMIRLHWVMEWQRRGVPHLHVAVWYDPDQLRPVTAEVIAITGRAVHPDCSTAGIAHKMAAERAIFDWLQLAEAWEAGSKGQQARPLTGPVGWFQYLAKHCGRGSKHYQRQQASLPDAWESSPRVWGKWGEWVTEEEPEPMAMSRRQWFRLRRLVRSQRVARARAAVPGPGWTWRPPLFSREELRGMNVGPGLLGDCGRALRPRLRNLRQARGMLSCSQRSLSEVRGISEWITPDQQGDLLRAVEG